MLYQKNATLQKIISHQLLKLATQSIDFSGKKILDVGSGSGFIAQNLVQSRILPHNIMQVDKNESSLKYAKKFGNTLKANFNDPMHLQQEYDIIFSSMALQWAKNPQLAVEYLKNSLKKNGHIFIALPILGSVQEILNVTGNTFRFPDINCIRDFEIMEVKTYNNNAYISLKNMHIEGLKINEQNFLKKSDIKNLRMRNTFWKIAFLKHSNA